MADMTMPDPRSGVIKIQQQEKKKSASIWQIALRRFLKHRMAVLGVILLVLVAVYCIGGTLLFSEGYANEVTLADKYQPPNTTHLFGTDSVGRDLMARTIYGGQISLMIGIFSVTISITLGTLVGVISGYFGGWVDSIFMRFTEALLSIPALVLLLLFSRSLQGNTTTINVFGRVLSTSVVAIVLIIGLLGWMNLARIVRSVVLSLKEQEFVLAATTIGATSWRIIFGHILPNCIAPVIVSATLGVGGAIITEAYLSFLGFGVMAPTATWGNILNSAQNQLQLYPWMWVFPSGLIIITVLAINFIGDGLRDAFDPRSTR
jgi:peptide/nickel transport system permease protein